ncbi:hypothetical protein [Actinacidiphila bryophytorum]|uniref:hypothetical protein n=1 Tax=Actinacidiphila bryophytorum TaxID=1436133 RepID=UPI002176EB44|nr:hypothetical protein [Actinacidiphila bryophytorum]UWE13254.1 hypothetical protein NYE86_34340 [Actinacidiphila bryophytorum]
MRTPLLSVRAALVLTLALLTGLGAGVMSAVGGADAARCVLCGAGAFGLAVPFFDRLIGTNGPE